MGTSWREHCSIYLNSFILRLLHSQRHNLCPPIHICVIHKYVCTAEAPLILSIIYGAEHATMHSYRMRECDCLKWCKFYNEIIFSFIPHSWERCRRLRPIYINDGIWCVCVAAQSSLIISLRWVWWFFASELHGMITEKSMRFLILIALPFRLCDACQRKTVHFE